MTSHERTRALRRYLLGAAGEEQCTAIEQDYFDRALSLQELSEVEDDLIADYLDRRLTAEELGRFERHYLASPSHRTRVAVLRALRGSAPQKRWWTQAAIGHWAPRVAQAAAAIALVALGVAIWRGDLRLTETRQPPAVDARRSAPEPAQPLPRRQPVVVALSIAPVNVRAGGEAATLTLSTNPDVVDLQLQGDAGERPVEGGRAIVRTVSGREAWSGPASPPGSAQPDIVARLEIPAVDLSPDDYVVQLLEPGTRGREVERNRYFFRVRQR